MVFHRPPPVAPKYASRGRPFTPLTAIDRPPRAGPMLRHLYELSNASFSDGVGVDEGVCADDETVRRATTTKTERVIAGKCNSEVWNIALRNFGTSHFGSLERRTSELWNSEPRTLNLEPRTSNFEPASAASELQSGQ